MRINAFLTLNFRHFIRIKYISLLTKFKYVYRAAEIPEPDGVREGGCVELLLHWANKIIDCALYRMASLNFFALHSHSLVAIAVNSVQLFWTAHCRSFAEISLNICRNRTFRMVL